MNTTMQSSVLSVIGAVTVTATATGIFTNFVKPGLRWFLVVAGLILLVMGIYGVLTAKGDGSDEVADDPGHAAESGRADDSGHADDPAHADDSGHDAGHGHDHARGPRVGWLLLAPFLLLGFVVPPPLGAWSAQRDSGAVRQSGSVEGELPPGEVVRITLADYSMRALADEGRSLQGRTVQLLGFSTPDTQAVDGWTLARMTLSCCAADSYAIKVEPTGSTDAPPKGAWVAVTGTWEKSPDDGDEATFELPRLKVSAIEQVEEPEQPYE